MEERSENKPRTEGHRNREQRTQRRPAPVTLLCDLGEVTFPSLDLRLHLRVEIITGRTSQGCFEVSTMNAHEGLSTVPGIQ